MLCVLWFAYWLNFRRILNYKNITLCECKQAQSVLSPASHITNEQRMQKNVNWYYYGMCCVAIEFKWTLASFFLSLSLPLTLYVFCFSHLLFSTSLPFIRSCLKGHNVWHFYSFRIANVHCHTVPQTINIVVQPFAAIILLLYCYYYYTNLTSFSCARFVSIFLPFEFYVYTLCIHFAKVERAFLFFFSHSWHHVVILFSFWTLVFDSI